MKNQTLAINTAIQPDGTTVCILSDEDGNEYLRGPLSEVHRKRREIEREEEQEKRDEVR